MSRKICKNCKLFVTKDTCPLCKGHQFSDSFKGRVFIMNPEKSQVAKNMGLKAAGEYAIKVR